jgi:glucokinase
MLPMTFVVGIDLGGTNIKGALVERERGIVSECLVKTEAALGPEHVMDRLAMVVCQMKESAPGGRVSGIGIGSPGAVNLDRDTIAYPPNFPGWTRVNVVDEIRRRVGTSEPIVVENDAGAAALGSSYFGAGQQFHSFIMVTLGTGVGGGIIYQNRLFRGSTGAAAEIGHMTVDYEGPIARSGVAGAIEAYLGQRFLTYHAQMQILNRPDSILQSMAGDELVNLTPRMLTEAAEMGDKAAIDVLAWAGHKLGVVLGSAVNLLDIRKIVVGGGISAAGDFILEPARKILPRYVTPGLQEDLEIVRETLGNEVGLLGAASLIFEHLDAYASEAGRT